MLSLEIVLPLPPPLQPSFSSSLFSLHVFCARDLNKSKTRSKLDKTETLVTIGDMTVREVIETDI